MITDNKSGEREAVAWRYRVVDVDGKQLDGWQYKEEPSALGLPEQPLFSLSQLEAVERERDALAKVIDPEDNRPALMARIIMRSIENKTNAEDYAAQVTSLQQQVAELKGALEQSARHFDAIRGAVESNQVVDKDVRGTAVFARDTIRSTLTREAPNE